MKFLSLFPYLAVATAAAHPVAFQGANQVMFGGMESVQMAQYYHSYSPTSAVGFHGLRFNDEADETYLGAQHNWLLKRWNLPEAQGNVYVAASAGAAKREGDAWEPAALGYFRADYETRRIYTSFDATVVGAERVNRGMFELAAGVAPYLAEYDELNTWLILQLQHVTGMDENLSVIPKVRFFKDTYFLELGCSLKGEPLVNFMIHF